MDRLILRNFPTLFHHNPWTELEDFFSFEKNLFRKSDCNYPYNVITQKDGTHIIEYSLAGFKKENIEISVEDDALIIKANKGKDEKSKDELHYIHKGIAKRSMVHKIYVKPEILDVKNISAEMNDGILTIIIPSNKDVKKNNFKVDVK